MDFLTTTTLMIIGRVHFTYLLEVSMSTKTQTQKMKRERRHLLQTARTNALRNLTAEDLMRPAMDVLPSFTEALADAVGPVVEKALSRTLTKPLLVCDVARYHMVRGADAAYCTLSECMMRAGFVGNMLDLEENVTVMCEFLKVMVRMYGEVVAQGEACANEHVPKTSWVGRKLHF